MKRRTESRTGTLNAETCADALCSRSFLFRISLRSPSGKAVMKEPHINPASQSRGGELPQTSASPVHKTKLFHYSALQTQRRVAETVLPSCQVH
ncbi:hypothetical protein AAFF_G00019770 [Aldrovandia affinis]|uniref:Uncharacterized protein n=1 Tax=Aldrovandia affinis TaxID=143900 RepID=A0AAD7S5L0_9TELE|nr:hypothetical protein AAFF_G00019770 [Aldrovandia affinis]